ncbi:YkgJ family cysteine cluster protein [bacterium]|nr:YkgJ family cysteine cluster protein [bacterium]
MNIKFKSGRKFYSAGVKFECQKDCTKCCEIEGTVWLTENEANEIANDLGLALQDFKKKFTKIVENKLTLLEKENEHCIFLEQGEGCLIHEVKPMQCQTYPFWNVNIETEKDWEEIKNICVGVGLGKVYTADEIEMIALKNETKK